jgi:hypothetical protein
MLTNRENPNRASIIKNILMVAAVIEVPVLFCPQINVMLCERTTVVDVLFTYCLPRALSSWVSAADVYGIGLVHDVVIDIY